MAKNALKDEGIGWASKALGINSPLTSNSDLAKKLAAISDQITALAGQLTEFEAQAEYTAAVNKLGNDVVTPTNSTAAALLETLEESQQNPMTTWWDFNSPNPVVAALTNAYSLYSASSGIEELVSYLVGTYNPDGANKRLERLLVAVINPPFGIDSDLAVYNGYGAYSNQTLNQQRAMIEYYFQVLEQAAEVYSEQVHNVEDPQTLVTNIRAGQAYLASLARVKKEVLQQLPDPLPSDDIFVDREWGLVWYMGNPGKNASHVRYDSAVDFAAKFPGVGPYTDGWRLPSPGELNHLYLRIEAGAKAKSITHDKRALVLERWGWDLSYMTDDHQVWSSEYDVRVSLDTGKRHGDSTFNDNDIVLVRDFPKSSAVGTPESNPSLVPPLSELSVTSLTLGAASFPTPPAQQQLSASAALSSSSGGDFTVDGTNYSHPSDKGVSVSSVDLTSRVVWTSSNDSMASVSNFEGSEGQLTWHSQLNNQALQPVTITATFLGISTQTTFQPPTSLPAVLDSIWVSPYNVGFEQPTAATPIQTRFGAVLFYLDPTTGDSLVQGSNEANAPTLTWSLSDKLSGAALTRTSRDSGFEDGSLLVLTSTLASPDMNVKASTGAISGIGPIHAAIVPGP